MDHCNVQPGPQTTPLSTRSNFLNSHLMAAFGEPLEVKATFVNLLHERGFSVDQPAIPQHSVHLRGDLLRLDDVLKDSLDPHAVDATISQRNAMGICHKLHIFGAVDVEGNHIDIGPLVKRFRSVADHAGSNDQHTRPAADTQRSQVLQEMLGVDGGDPVGAVQEPRERSQRRMPTRHQ